MGMTMAQRILARAAGSDTELQVGDAVMCELAAITMIDLYEFAFVEDHGLSLAHPERLIICFDHFPDDSMGSYAASVAHPKLRTFVRAHGIPAENVFDADRRGISHHVPVEEGFVVPGDLCGAFDTEGATLGAMNSFSFPLMSSFGAAIVDSETWMVVPESIRIDFHGTLAPGVTGKDVVLHLLRDLHDVVNGRVVEYGGPGLAGLSIDQRLAIANGAHHLGALTAIFPCDDRLLEYLRGRARRPVEPVAPDEDAVYAGVYDCDLDDVGPMVSGPGAITALASIERAVGIPVDAAYVGSCSSGRLEDLELAAAELEGRRVHPRVRMVVTPISTVVMRQATERGLIETMRQAGAIVTEPGCGACFYGNQSPLRLEPGEVCISGSVENTPGRMGSSTAEIYLGNAAVVAASAVAGKIALPSSTA